MHKNASQLVAEESSGVWIITITWQSLQQRQKRFLNRIVRRKEREMLGKKRLHHRAITGDELTPSRMFCA